MDRFIAVSKNLRALVMVNMAENTADSEYSLQYWDFTPDQFFKEFSVMILEEMSAITQQAIKIWSEPSCQLEDKEALIQNALKLHDVWGQRVYTALGRLEPTIKEFFTIPKNVLLPSDEMQIKQFDEADVTKLELEVEELEKEYVKQSTNVARMKAELTILEKIVPLQSKVDEGIVVLKQFESTLREIKELEKFAKAYEECKSVLGNNDDGEDSSGDDTYAIQASKFKTGT